MLVWGRVCISGHLLLVPRMHSRGAKVGRVLIGPVLVTGQLHMACAHLCTKQNAETRERAYGLRLRIDYVLCDAQHFMLGCFRPCGAVRHEK